MKKLPKTNPVIPKLGVEYLKKLPITYYFIQSQQEARNLKLSSSDVKERLRLVTYSSSFYQSEHNYIHPLQKRLVCEK